jgi:hypothetical protein
LRVSERNKKKANKRRAHLFQNFDDIKKGFAVSFDLLNRSFLIIRASWEKRAKQTDGGQKNKNRNK